MPDNPADDIYGMTIPALFEALLRESEDSIYFKDCSSRFVYVSARHAEKFGVTSIEDIRGKTDFDFFTEEHARQAFEDEQNIFKTGKPLINIREKETWPDGSVSWVTSTKIPLHLASGKLVGLLGISRDITNEVVALEKLERSETRLRERDRLMQMDLDNARRVQEALIPGEEIETSFIRTSVVYDSMDAVGGDVISFPFSSAERVAFVLGDVCGHGVSASLYTLLFKHIADTAIRHHMNNLVEAFAEIDEETTELVRPHYITSVGGIIEQREGGAFLRIAHAGHPSFLHYRKSSAEVESVSLAPQDAFGLDTGRGRRSDEIELASGDRLLFYTDGVIEAISPAMEEFSLERLRDALSQMAAQPVEAVTAALRKAITEHQSKAPRTDDISLILIEVC